MLLARLLMPRFLLFFLCCLLALVSSSAPRQWVCRMGSRVLIKESPGMFRPDSIGTTFLVAGFHNSSNLRTFLTAQHVVAEGVRSRGEQLFVFPPGVADITKLPRNEMYGWHVESWVLDDTRDLAILSVNVPPNFFGDTDGFHVGNWEDVKTQVSARVLGYEVGESTLGKRTGMIVGTSFMVLLLDVAVPSGYSGGPLILSSKVDTVVGVLIRSVTNHTGRGYMGCHSASLNHGIISQLQQQQRHHQQSIMSWIKPEL